MSRLFINTYAPLVSTPSGQDASERYGIPPFIDGSIRREPDLENPYPSITCLCRGRNFAPRLELDDHVVYMTRKRRLKSAPPHQRMTAILRVVRVFDTHEAAAEWYRAKGVPVPNNCMVDGNPPHAVRESHRDNGAKDEDEDRWTHRWDLMYQRRARVNSRFVVCEPLWRDFSWKAPEVHRSHLVEVFGRIPGTRNPGALTLSLLPLLAQQLQLPWPPSAP